MNPERILMVLKEPHTSEKSTDNAERRKQITFKVLSTATKREIKTAVEELFKVRVLGVTTVNIPGKRKRFKQTDGQRKSWKKAYVSLHPEDDIDFQNVAEKV